MPRVLMCIHCLLLQQNRLCGKCHVHNCHTPKWYSSLMDFGIPALMPLVKYHLAKKYHLANGVRRETLFLYIVHFACLSFTVAFKLNAWYQNLATNFISSSELTLLYWWMDITVIKIVRDSRNVWFLLTEFIDWINLIIPFCKYVPSFGQNLFICMEYLLWCWKTQYSSHPHCTTMVNINHLK